MAISNRNFITGYCYKKIILHAIFILTTWLWFVLMLINAVVITMVVPAIPFFALLFVASLLAVLGSTIRVARRLPIPERSSRGAVHCFWFQRPQKGGLGSWLNGTALCGLAYCAL